MKTVLIIIAALIGLSAGLFFLPAIVAIVVAIIKFKNGHILGAIISIIIGGVIQIFWSWYFSGDGGSSAGYTDEECPYCGSSATDGNHCEECGEDF